jgi:putative ABC transport system permease protein
MLTNYIKMAFRNLRRHALTSFINLSGLTIGLTCCLLILVYVLHELSYDRYNRNADRIYRVTRTFYGPNHSVSLTLGTVAPPFGPLLKNDFPDIEVQTQALPTGILPVRYGEKRFNENNAFFADENLAKVFDLTMVYGERATTALREPFSVILDEAEAKKYFGDVDPTGKVLRMSNQFDVKVTGVYKAFPENAHMHPEMLVSFSTLNDTAVYGAQQLRTNYGNNSFLTYLLMPAHYPVDKMIAQFPAFIDRHLQPNPNGTKASTQTSLELQKLTDIHLRSHTDYEVEENGNSMTVAIFGAIALFILLIACINYMNLATARSALRAREIGIRKTVGADRTELILQFLSESVLISWMAMILAFCLTTLILPLMGGLAGRTLSMGVLTPARVWLPLVLLPFMVGILSGLYPAMVLSGFKPVKVLKGIFKAGNSDLSLRRVLVVFQFSISIVLIIATWIVFRQIGYMLNKPLGYNKDYLVVTNYQNDLDKTFDAFRNQLLADPHVQSVSRSSRIPTGRLLDEQGVYIMGSDSLVPVNVNLKYVVADENFIPTLGIHMVTGRNFSKAYGTDTASFIINESAVVALGYKTPRNALGKAMSYGGQKGNVIGVMSDIYFESLHQQITPLLLTYPGKDNSQYGKITVKLSGSDVPVALEHLQRTWRTFAPEKALDYVFLDNRFENLYKAETRQGTIFTLFAGIAIFIACLGLLGLSAFTISQRVKEIGIRKVLGAGTGSIVRLISTDFMKLVFFAALIAFPVAWYATHQWLQGYAYRINVPWWIFGAAGLISLGIAFATISIQTIRAARTNPVKNLRSE